MKELKDFTKEELLEIVKIKNYRIKELEEEILLFKNMADKLLKDTKKVNGDKKRS